MQYAYTWIHIWKTTLRLGVALPCLFCSQTNCFIWRHCVRVSVALPGALFSLKKTTCSTTLCPVERCPAVCACPVKHRFLFLIICGGRRPTGTGGTGGFITGHSCRKGTKSEQNTQLHFPARGPHGLNSIHVFQHKKWTPKASPNYNTFMKYMPASDEFGFVRNLVKLMAWHGCAMARPSHCGTTHELFTACRLKGKLGVPQHNWTSHVTHLQRQRRLPQRQNDSWSHSQRQCAF